MKILFYGIAIFCLALFLHLFIWKIRIPRNQTKAILQTFFGILILSSIVLCSVTQLAVGELLHIAIFFISLTLAYIATYPAIEVDSPTLVMAVNIAGAGNEGLDKGKLEQLMNDDLLVKPRIKDLVNAKMVYLDADKFKLTPRGFLFIRIFIFYRKLLNTGKGG